MRLGSGYLGSKSLQTSTANQEIVPLREDKGIRYRFYKFTFMNSNPCTVVINDQFEIFLQENQGFAMDEIDSPIYSFVIKEANVTFNWIGAFGA